MDIASVFGLIFGIGCILFGYGMDGGNVRSLWMLSAMIITLGGSIGAVFVCYGIDRLKLIPGLLLKLLVKPKSTISSTIEYLIKLSKTARQNGLLSLEKIIATDDNPKKPLDPFLKRGILMVVDGTDPEKISDILQNEIYVYEQNMNINFQMFDSLTSFCPAFGMVGTIVGLIQVLSQGMDDPNSLTKAIGIAFITTLYGVLLANLLFLPASTKLKSRLAAYRLEKEMIIEAVCAIRNGVNPRMLREQLSSYLATETKTRRKKSPKYASKDLLNDEPVDSEI
jgi:chemotaxis protein MotA